MTKPFVNDCDPTSLFSWCQCEDFKDKTENLKLDQCRSLNEKCMMETCKNQTDVRSYCVDPAKPVCDCEGNREIKSDPKGSSGRGRGDNSGTKVVSALAVVCVLVLSWAMVSL